ncbi:HNH endonuclease [Cryobacterium sp. Y57]|uniref:HNH endonuclease n=1 Tax=Cryobacterium sp. Y57 TaxID=2048287 RepID=UPI0018EBD52F|nr:HNH endonuclease [Cryobacterium sp. Y57]
MAAQYRNDRAYVAKREALKRQARKTGAPCHLCGKPFDYELDWKHPMAFTADHIDAVGNGGSMTGALKPAHRSCNSRRGKKALEGIKALQAPKTSRKW